MSLTQRIQENFHSFTKSEKRVAKYLLEVGQKAVYQTMKEVTENTNVGDATLVRFCQKLGYSGFSDLKIDIAKEDFTNQYDEESDREFYDNIMENQVKVLNSTRQLINPDNIDAVVEAIGKARHIHIIGVGASGVTANSLQKMFLRVGIQATYSTDPHFQAQTLSLLGPKDLVISLSLSGRTKDTFDSLQIAKDNQTKIISITNFLSSPIAQLGDIVLQTANEEFFDGGSLAGKISQLYICEVVVRGYEIKNKIHSVELREKVLRSIIDKIID